MTRHRVFLSRVKRVGSLLARGSVLMIALLLAAAVAAGLLSEVPARRVACDDLQSVGPQERATLSEDQAAELVLERWLGGHMLQRLCPSQPGWITAYSIEEPPHQFRDSADVAYPVYVTTFSVRPLSPLDGGWDGAGEPASGGWIRHRTIFFTVERNGGRFVFHEHGTSPI